MTHRYNGDRRATGSGGPVELHVAALAADDTTAPDSFLIRARFGCHNSSAFSVDRAGAEALVEMLTEALAVGVSWGNRAEVPAAVERLPIYEPTGPVVDGVEVTTGRLACCGAGPDRRGDTAHLPGCRHLAAVQLEQARKVLVGDADEDCEVCQNERTVHDPNHGLVGPCPQCRTDEQIAWFEQLENAAYDAYDTRAQAAEAVAR